MSPRAERALAERLPGARLLPVDADVKGDAYEGLLAKNAEDVKSGAGSEEEDQLMGRGQFKP